MVEKILEKIRSLITDWSKSDFHIFTYTNSNIFTLPEPNVTSVTSVLVNGKALESGESFSFNSTTKQVTVIGVDFSTGDSIEINYVFNEYSNLNLQEYLRASLCWLSIFGNCSQDFEFENDIHPSPENKTCDLIAIIASIIINPDCHEYKLGDIVVKCPVKKPKEEKIEDLIDKFNIGIGAVGVIEINLD